MLPTSPQGFPSRLLAITSVLAATCWVTHFWRFLNSHHGFSIATTHVYLNCHKQIHTCHHVLTYNYSRLQNMGIWAYAGLPFSPGFWDSDNHVPTFWLLLYTVVYVWTYIHTHVHIYIHIHTCIYMYISANVYICIYLYTCIYIYTHATCVDTGSRLQAAPHKGPELKNVNHGLVDLKVSIRKITQ